MPEWLAHLRTDERGLPVPYVNLWGAEDVSRIDVRHDPHVGMDAVFLDDAAELVPDFTRQSMQRQRECMAGGLCQVCGLAVPAGPRTLVVADISVQRIELQGQPCVVVTEPWLCRRCALFARDRCPALIRRGREENLRLLTVPRWHLTTSLGYVDGPFEAQTRENPAAMWVKVVLPET